MPKNRAGAMGGRSASIRIAQRLRAALDRGRPMTYVELARAAGCTVRSVRNYLADASSTLGVAVRIERGVGRSMRVAVAEAGAATMDEIGRAVARDLLRRLFPLEGTSLDSARHTGLVQIAVAVRGTYEYGEQHLRAMRAWIQAASSRPRRAVRFDYDAADGSAPRVVWPIGVVLRDAASVYLAGVPAEAATARSVHTYALHRVVLSRSGSVRLVTPGDAGTPPRGIDSAAVEDGIDSPFSMFPAGHENAVNVHVEFSSAQARYVENRRWHRHQSTRRRRDGTLVVKFGPADLHETMAWIRQWGESVTVHGDARLLSAMSERCGSGQK